MNNPRTDLNPSLNIVLRTAITHSYQIQPLSQPEVAIATPEILFVTSYPPRECGIATYSQDLISALNQQFEHSFTCSVCALEQTGDNYKYESTPKYRLDTLNVKSMIDTAQQISDDPDVKLVIIQHEFGFFASCSVEFRSFLEQISQPVIVVFHTVLPHPNDELLQNVRDMSALSSSVVVMTTNAAKLLTDDYGIASHKITVIAHGTHLVAPIDKDKLKKNYDLTSRKVLSTFGLLSSSKNIETTLKALPRVIERHPDVLFLAIGKTHPSVVKQEGERYRNLLEEQVHAMGLMENVRFVNEYLPLPTLLDYLQLSDIYLFTSKDPNQAVSGTFSYAVSCGCPVISTPIPHAKELFRDNKGLIIDFENSDQLAEAIIRLLDDEQKRVEMSLHSFHTMASTAWQNSALSHAVVFKMNASEDITLHYKIPPINLKHIKKLTTHFGMIQFSKIANPDIESGFTLDDNARALIAICQHYALFKNPTDLVLINTYMEFIRYCLKPNGLFYNYINKSKHITDQNYEENLEDSTGRAIWALGYVSSLEGVLPSNLVHEANNLLQYTKPHVLKIHSTRAMAFMIKGWSYQNQPEGRLLITSLANRLVNMFLHEKTEDWRWFEHYLTYGNSLIPEAMLCAYKVTGQLDYKEVAMDSFDFLLSKIIKNDRIRVISNKGWRFKNEVNRAIVGGEQPIDVAYTVLALETFYSVLKKEEYKQKAQLAFHWFLGDNHLHQIVYNPCTGGCYDGVEEENINLNQGAESTVSYLMARLAIERMFCKESS
ncbi:MAG: glycosyltransferase [Bacteroidota bacterium]|jgi:glycosyltransferase involved in cell wall biosynthesis